MVNTTSIVDLHTHTTASDGQYSPFDVVRLAASRGIQTISITDHDTIDGIPEAVDASHLYGVDVIPGIEMSANGYHSFHLLGYGWEYPAPMLEDLCCRMRESRNKRNVKIIQFLSNKGINISIDEVENVAKGVVGKPHFASVLVKHGYADTVQDAFERYLNTDEFRLKIKRDKFTAAECIRAVKESGGKVSLAHPYQLKIDDATLKNLIVELKEYGLDAIECYYSRYTREQSELYCRLAKMYGLQMSGGSDFHGEKVKPDIDLARYEIDISWIYNR